MPDVPSPTAPDPPPDEGPGRLSFARRVPARVFGVLTAGSAVGSLVLGVIGAAPPMITGRLAGVALFIAAVLFGGRLWVHVEDGYWRCKRPFGPGWRPSDRRWLSAVTFGEGVLTAAMAGLGVWFFITPHPWLQLAVGLAATLALVVLCDASGELAARAGLPPGSQTVGRCAAVRWVRRIRRRLRRLPGVEAVDRFLWEDDPSPTDFGVLVLLILLILMATATSQGVALAPEFRRFLDRGNAATSTSSTSTTRTPSPTRTTSTETTHEEGEGQEEPSDDGDDEPAPPSGNIRPGTYEDECGKILEPGDGIPGRAASDLRAAWYALGARIAACAEVARLVRGTLDVYYVRGMCGGEFRSLGVVSPRHPAAVLVDQPAHFARRHVATGTLRGASERTSIGNGDFVIIYTAAGPFVLIRRELTDGRGGAGDLKTCWDVEPARTTYVVLGPALAELWLRLGAQGLRSWPEIDTSRPAGGRQLFSFSSATSSGTVVARASCDDDGGCYLRAGDLVWTADAKDARSVTVERVLRYGPS